MTGCQHMQFKASVNVNRLEDVGKFTADVTIECSDCGLPFEFLGMEPGSSFTHPRVSIDGTEARMPIGPRGAQPNPFQQMAHGIKRFDS